MNTREEKQKQYKNRAKYKKLLNMENKQRVTEGLWEGGWAKWLRGIKESTPEITVALYAN